MTPASQAAEDVTLLEESTPVLATATPLALEDNLEMIIVAAAAGDQVGKAPALPGFTWLELSVTVRRRERGGTGSEEEEEGSWGSHRRRMRCLSMRTWKVTTRPTGMPDKRRCVMTCATWTGSMRPTTLSSTSTLLSMTRSARSPQSTCTPSYESGNALCRSRQMHASYADSSRPGPR